MRISPADLRTQPVDPAALLGYLRSSSWRKIQDQSHGAILSSTLMVHDDDQAEVQVPLVPEARDYARAVAEVVNRLADVERRAAHLVLSDLRVFRSDVVRIRRTGREDDSIPIGDGSALFSLANGALQAASLAVVEPRASYAGRRPAKVKDFMDTVHLGQTERGSFVVRLLVPLPAHVGQRQRKFEFADERAPAPFSRQVTHRLIEAVQRAKAAVTAAIADDSLDPFRAEIDNGVSADLCKALGGVEDVSLVHGVEIGVAWGMSWPARRRRPVVFGRDSLRILNQAGEYLAATSVNEDYELEGYVTKLERDEPDGSIEGDITVAASFQGKLRRVRVTLQPDDYEKATNAHLGGHRVRVRGDLAKEGKRFRLRNPSRFEVVVVEDDE